MEFHVAWILATKIHNAFVHTEQLCDLEYEHEVMENLTGWKMRSSVAGFRPQVKVGAELVVFMLFFP